MGKSSKHVLQVFQGQSHTMIDILSAEVIVMSEYIHIYIYTYITSIATRGSCKGHFYHLVFEACLSFVE